MYQSVYGTNNAFTPYGYQMPQIPQMPVQPQQVERVNGENGVDAYRMAPNSSALLLDENDPIVWFVRTDSAGYKSKTPYKIEPYAPEPEPDMKSIDERINEINSRLQVIEEALK